MPFFPYICGVWKRKTAKISLQAWWLKCVWERYFKNSRWKWGKKKNFEKYKKIQTKTLMLRKEIKRKKIN